MLALPDLVDFFVNKFAGLSGRGFAVAFRLASLFDGGFQWHKRKSLKIIRG
jgi:hypothetical protein